jgi:hypothetical protein
MNLVKPLAKIAYNKIQGNLFGIFLSFILFSTKFRTLKEFWEFLIENDFDNRKNR